MYEYQNYGRIGLTGAQTGGLVMKLAPSLAAIPVVGVFAAAGAELVGAMLSIFGNRYETSTGVRWLTQYYEKYVMGLNTRSDNTVNEGNVDAAQTWFSYVLGVPIYDKYRLGALMGYDTDANRSLNWTDEQKVQDYLKYDEAKGIDPAIVMQAVQIAKKLKWTDPLGGWASFPPAPSTIATTATETTNQAPAPSGAGSGTTNILGGDSKTLLIILAIAAGLYIAFDVDT